MENNFKKGLILGGLLVVAAAVGFAMSKEGRKLAKELKEDIEPMAKHFKKNMCCLHDAAREDFDELAAIIVDDYVKKKEIGDDSKQKLTNALKTKWHEIKDEYVKEGV